MMQVQLVVASGKTRVRAITLRSQVTVIGRKRGCGIRIPASEVSRRHCELRIEDGFVTLLDLDSANGTFVNGERLGPVQHIVRAGDLITIGPLVFIVEYAGLPILELEDEPQVEFVVPLDDVIDVEVVDDAAESEAIPVSDEFLIEEVPTEPKRRVRRDDSRPPRG